MRTKFHRRTLRFCYYEKTRAPPPSPPSIWALGIGPFMYEERYSAARDKHFLRLISTCWVLGTSTECTSAVNKEESPPFKMVPVHYFRQSLSCHQRLPVTLCRRLPSRPGLLSSTSPSTTHVFLREIKLHLVFFNYDFS